MGIAAAMGAFLVRAVILLLATFRFGVAILVAIVAVLGLITDLMVVSLWGDSGQRRLKGAVLIEKIVVVHDGFLEDVNGHGLVRDGWHCRCGPVCCISWWRSYLWSIICKLFSLILAFGVFDSDEIFAREL
jgi:hypothetical protein